MASRSPESDCATGYCQVARRRPCSLHVSAGADWCVGVGVFETVLRGPSTKAFILDGLRLTGDTCWGSERDGDEVYRVGFRINTWDTWAHGG